MAQPFLHVGDVVVGCWDTACTRVFVVKPFVRDMRVAQNLDACHLLPCSFGQQGVFKRGNRVLSDNRESWAWSCGAFSRPFRAGT